MASKTYFNLMKPNLYENKLIISCHKGILQINFWLFQNLIVIKFWILVTGKEGEIFVPMKFFLLWIFFFFWYVSRPNSWKWRGNKIVASEEQLFSRKSGFKISIFICTWTQTIVTDLKYMTVSNSEQAT